MRATLITTLCAAGVVSAQVPAQARRTKFKPPLEPMVPIVPASLTDFIPKVPRNVPKLKLSLEGGQLRLPSNADNIVNGSNVCKTQTDTTTIEDCEFKVETTIYCSAEDTWGGVEVTEKGSGESVKTDTTHCSGDSDCEDAMTKLASEAIAYLYKYPLGSTIGKVEDGVCSCGVTTTTQFGENFDIGLCVTFDSYKNLEAEEVSFKAYAQGDKADDHIGYTYDFNCKDEGYSNVTECALQVGTLAVTAALQADQMSGTGGVYSTSDGGYPEPDVLSGAADDDNDKVLGDGPTFCPYGSSENKVGYFKDKGGDKGKLYMCTIKGVTSDPLKGWGGMYQEKSRRRQLRGADGDEPIVGDNNYPNPWTGDESCPSGYEDSKTWRIVSWDNEEKAYIHICNGKEPAGLIAGGYQTSDNDDCDKTNHYTGKESCPDGYKAVKVAKGDCNSKSSEMYLCYNEDQLA